jgi:hypothetical protein
MLTLLTENHLLQHGLSIFKCIKFWSTLGVMYILGCLSKERMCHMLCYTSIVLTLQDFLHVLHLDALKFNIEC